jgi:Transposase DDE domain
VWSKQQVTNPISQMDIKITTEKWIILYCEIDDLLKSYESWQSIRAIGPTRKATRRPLLSGSEVATIMAGYHLSGYKCFEYYYHQLKANSSQDLFPNMPSYKCFLSYIPMVLPLLYLWAKHKAAQSARTGYYFIDAKKIQVCHVKREHQNKVFKGIASKGKTSVGWFYGLKLHLVTNHLGEIVSFMISKGSVSDNNKSVLQDLLKGLKGICTGDKGYYTTLFEEFYNGGLHLLVKRKKNAVKKALVEYNDSEFMKKRGAIESTFDILSSICDIEHSRHRSPTNALAHILGAIIAYQHLDTKPHIFIKGAQNYLKMAA